MKKCVLLLPVFAGILTGCGQIEKMNRMINCSTQAIHRNREVIEMSTCTIRQNAELIRQSNQAVSENRRQLEAMQE